MILKYIKHEKEQDKLMEKINMRQVEKEIHKLVYDEYGDVLDAKDKEIENNHKEIETKNQEITKLTKDKEKSKKTTRKIKTNGRFKPRSPKNHKHTHTTMRCYPPQTSQTQFIK